MRFSIRTQNSESESAVGSSDAGCVLLRAAIGAGAGKSERHLLVTFSAWGMCRTSSGKMSCW